MKIFVLLSRIPWPLEKGDKLRAFHQIRELSAENEVVVCALNTDPKADKQAAFRALQPYCVSVNFIDLPFYVIVWNLFVAWISGRPMQTGYFYGAGAAKRVKKLIAHHKPQLLYGQLLRVAEYIRKEPYFKVLDYQDVFSKGIQRRIKNALFWKKPLFRTEYKRLLRYEEAIFDDFDIKTIISKPDRDLIPHPERDKIMILPNGVDHDFFKPIEKEKEYDIVFTGNMAYPPNVNAAVFLVRVIMPLVWKELPSAKVLIAGATPDKQVKLLKQENVFISGWLDDIRDGYSSAKVFIAPMRIGTGLQNKLLEAMSMKMPSVTTSLAHSALGGEPGKDLLVEESPEALAQALVRLLTDADFAETVAKNGHDFVKKQYHWGETIQRLQDEIKKMLPKT